MRVMAMGVLSLAVGLASCSAQVEQDAAASVATRFATTASADPAAACALLAPATVEELEDSSDSSCQKALPTEEIPADSKMLGAEVDGHQAQVRFEGQTVFLTRFDEGWKVVAAGCTRHGSDEAQPYSCLVKGR